MKSIAARYDGGNHVGVADSSARASPRRRKRRTPNAARQASFIHSDSGRLPTSGRQLIFSSCIQTTAPPWRRRYLPNATVCMCRASRGAIGCRTSASSCRASSSRGFRRSEPVVKTNSVKNGYQPRGRIRDSGRIS